MPAHLLLFFHFTTVISSAAAVASIGPSPTTVIAGNATLLSPNHTFALGFFSTTAAAGGATCYLGIWYASIPIRTYVWVANRVSPAVNPAAAGLTADGRFAIFRGLSIFWSTDNSIPATQVQLLDTGNLVLLSSINAIVWQSFDHPTDTWLPDMPITVNHSITSWRSISDPSPGLYSLRLRPPEYGEFELVCNGSNLYWSTGSWLGARFAGVPEMSVPYVYNFTFGNPFTPEASFVYSNAPPLDSELSPLLTRFRVDSAGQLMQYTWSSQAASWEMFWARPETSCRVYGRCGHLGICGDNLLRPCDCPAGLRPSDLSAWHTGDYSGGCAVDSCANANTFEYMGPVEFDGAAAILFHNISQGFCEESCLKNCSCFGLNYDEETKSCRNFHGSSYNLQNSSASPALYLRVSANIGFSKNHRATWKLAATAAGGAFAALCIGCLVLMVIVKRSKEGGDRRKNDDGEVEFQAMNLVVFTYKELSSATKNFSEKLGHGGFGAVFRGELADGVAVAVKRLERPAGGGGDREFRAEVRTIGRVHHVNLVRLRGFCCDGAHRLLVYDYMPRGPLSSCLRRRHRHGQPVASKLTSLSLPWPARVRVAIGAARGIAYLHEECHDRIIHCDIKPENILLDDDFTPRISDFGLARLLGRELSRVLITTRGTWGYVAPEWISGVAITPKADVYSYGMTLLELLSGRRNVDAPACGQEDEENEGREWFFPPWAAGKIVAGAAEEVVDPELEGRYEKDELERIARVAVWCIQDEEVARPAMGDVVKMLEGAVEVAAPPLPQLLQALVTGDESFVRARRKEIHETGSSFGGSAELNRIGRSGLDVGEISNAAE